MTEFALSEEIINHIAMTGLLCCEAYSLSDGGNCKAIEHNMASPGPYAAENLLPGEQGRFFVDYCNWQRLPALRGNL